jgi:hypothetical protein
MSVIDDNIEDTLTKSDKIGEIDLVEKISTKVDECVKHCSVIDARLIGLERALGVRDAILSSISDPSRNYPKKFAISALHSSLGAPDFHALEYGQDGAAVRWTGPERTFSFSFFIDRSKTARMELSFVSLAAGLSRPGLLCEVDGQEIELRIEKVSNGYSAYATLPRRDNRGGTVVSFTCIRMKSPREDGSVDMRTLGLLFRRFSVDVDEV